jgi:hypothetical protein
VAAVAGALADDARIIGPGLLPELIRLTLEKSAEQLDTLLPVKDREHPERHLLVLALKQVLPVLAREPDQGAKWKPRLGPGDALALGEALLDEVAGNPQWLVDRAGKQHRLLGDVVAGVLDALRAHAGPHLRRETAMVLVAAAVEAVGTRFELGAGEQGKPLVALVVAAIVKKLHGDDAPLEAGWLFAREEALRRLTKLVLDEIAQAGARAKLPALVEAFLDDLIGRIRKGEPWNWEDLARALRARLAGG